MAGSVTVAGVSVTVPPPPRASSEMYDLPDPEDVSSASTTGGGGGTSGSVSGGRIGSVTGLSSDAWKVGQIRYCLESWSS